MKTQPMSETEILEKLCWYDPRQPDYDVDAAEGVKPRNDCYCDNCFYGRDRLALEILTLRGILAAENIKF